MNTVAPLKVFAEHGIIGACSCGKAVDLVRPSREDKPKWFTATCLFCNRQWKSAATIQEAVDNFREDVLFEV